MGFYEDFWRMKGIPIKETSSHPTGRWGCLGAALFYIIISIAVSFILMINHIKVWK